VKKWGWSGTDREEKDKRKDGGRPSHKDRSDMGTLYFYPGEQTRRW
jgi:hypothetical protein